MLQEIANQKGVSCRAQGWKVHLCAAQLLQLVSGRIALFSYKRGMADGESTPKQTFVLQAFEECIHWYIKCTASASYHRLLGRDFLSRMKCMLQLGVFPSKKPFSMVGGFDTGIRAWCILCKCSKLANPSLWCAGLKKCPGWCRWPEEAALLHIPGYFCFRWGWGRCFVF